MLKIQSNKSILCGLLFSLLSLCLLSACGSEGESTQTPQTQESEPAQENASTAEREMTEPEKLCDDATPKITDLSSLDELDKQVRVVIQNHQLTGDPRVISTEPCNTRKLPSINTPIVQLGKALFFTKSLSGDMQVACATCHHPHLGGGDNSSLPIGVDAVNEDLLGAMRQNLANRPVIKRHSPTVFNLGFWDSSLFWDSRVESKEKTKGKNGEGDAISTPDRGFDVAEEGHFNLASAQAGFPVTALDEMRGDNFEANNPDNQAVRDHLAARMGGYSIYHDGFDERLWLNEFLKVCDTENPTELPDSFRAACLERTAKSLITYRHIGFALAEYERSQVFVDTPWKKYVQGDLTALSDSAKRGALLFYQPKEQQGMNCVACHTGDFFTDEKHHATAFPQIGPGVKTSLYKGDDRGRGELTGKEEDAYAFRTPSLLNIANTAPYGHAGSYASLEEVIEHYVNPKQALDSYFSATYKQKGWCKLVQFRSIHECNDLFPDSEASTQRALEQLEKNQQAGTSLLTENPALTGTEVDDLANFLRSLSDPCVSSRECLSPWSPDPNGVGVDGKQLNFMSLFIL